MGFLDFTLTKLNPTQQYLSNSGTAEFSSETDTFSYQQCYEQIEIVQRAINMIVDDVAAIPTSVGNQLQNTYRTTPIVKKKTLERVLNHEANPFQDVNAFKRAFLLDLIIEGNAFLYFDGTHLYHQPATKMVVLSDPKTLVTGYKFENSVTFSPDEIIHIKDNSYKNIYRGGSRLEPALRTMKIIIEMRKFQDNFFKNGAVPGLVLKSPNTLNDRLKKKLLDEWRKGYRPSSGGRRPMILDSGLEIDDISNFNFKDLDFEASIKTCEETVLKSLGVPPILLDTGNNANLRPNHRLFYLETIIPILNKVNSALSSFFGFEVYEDTTYIEALRPELRDQAAYLQSLVNSGIITANEARDQLGLEPDSDPESDKLRIPANIAGSAANPSVGGAPKKDEDE